MKHILKSAFAATAILLAAPAGAAVVTIDFEGASGFYGPNDGGQSYLPGQYQGSGLNGLVFDTPIQVGNVGDPGPGMSGNVARQAEPPFGSANAPRGSSFGGLFDGFTVASLSFVVGDSGRDLDVFRLLGFDSNGVQVADSGTISSNAATTVAISGTGIASFSLSISDNVPANGGSSVFDNVIFDTEVSAVPVPASLPLLAAGMLAFGFASRRRTAT